mmetsp:Transcript_31024/g.53024  ORF Transcript_31024/g.53024 Transcript_31024/m.53024 type:complete len:276 (-) Transcript_31024:107-934(-)
MIVRDALRSGSFHGLVRLFVGEFGQRHFQACLPVALAEHGVPVDIDLWKLWVLDHIKSPYGQQIQKLMIRGNIVLKVYRQDVLRERCGVDDDEALIVRKKGDEILVLRSAHDGHENHWEGRLVRLHLKGSRASLLGSRLGRFGALGRFLRCNGCGVGRWGLLVVRFLSGDGFRRVVHDFGRHGALLGRSSRRGRRRRGVGGSGGRFGGLFGRGRRGGGKGGAACPQGAGCNAAFSFLLGHDCEVRKSEEIVGTASGSGLMLGVQVCHDDDDCVFL